MVSNWGVSIFEENFEAVPGLFAESDPEILLTIFFRVELRLIPEPKGWSVEEYWTGRGLYILGFRSGECSVISTTSEVSF